MWQSLHNMGPSHVIISSISGEKIGDNKAMLQMRASSRLSSIIK